MDIDISIVTSGERISTPEARITKSGRDLTPIPERTQFTEE